MPTATKTATTFVAITLTLFTTYTQASDPTHTHTHTYTYTYNYKYPGLILTTPNFTSTIKLRAQLRATSEQSSSTAFNESDELRTQDINRARVKIGGKAGSDNLTYYTEYDFPSSRLLDLRFTLETNRDWLNLRVGQWKVPYNRERIDSSGKQQFADRSISNRWFTLDRQRGVAVFGRLAAGRLFDSTYHLGLLEGTGRNGDGDAEQPMWLARWDWHMTGNVLAFSQSDVKQREKSAGVISLLTNSYRGPYTAFSSGGGGQLPGYLEGADDQYRVRQYALESAFHYRGFSWQQELHQKEIRDTVNGFSQTARGGYAQVGYFPNALWPSLPHQLEIAVRYAKVDPATSRHSTEQTEVTIAVNWFFSGHDSKLTVDYSRGKGDILNFGASYRIVRLQWDFHL